MLSPLSLRHSYTFSISPEMNTVNPKSLHLLFTILSISLLQTTNSRTVRSPSHLSITYLWSLPAQFTPGNETLTVDPILSISLSGNARDSVIVSEAFARYTTIIFKHVGGSKLGGVSDLGYDICKFNVVVHSKDEELQLGVDESCTLLQANTMYGEHNANTMYGALRGLQI